MSRQLDLPGDAPVFPLIEGRHLLQRMVDYMLGQGVRQFLDLGSGLPSMASTHEIAHRAVPDARVVYVDIDPMVSSHASARMAGSNVATLRSVQEDDSDDGPVLKLVVPERSEEDRGAEWHLCGVGIKP